MGFHFLRTRKSALFLGAGEDARIVSRQVSALPAGWAAEWVSISLFVVTGQHHVHLAAGFVQHAYGPGDLLGRTGPCDLVRCSYQTHEGLTQPSFALGFARRAGPRLLVGESVGPRLAFLGESENPFAVDLLAHNLTLLLQHL